MEYIKRYNENIDWDWVEEDISPIPKEFKGHEDFYNFLKDNNALDKWIYNFNDYNNFINIGNFLNQIKLDGYMNSVFNWEGTPEKHNFWYRLDEKWKNIRNF